MNITLNDNKIMKCVMTLVLLILLVINYIIHLEKNLLNAVMILLLEYLLNLIEL